MIEQNVDVHDDITINFYILLFINFMFKMFYYKKLNRYINSHNLKLI